MQGGEIEYNQPTPLTHHRPPKQIIHNQPQPIEHQTTQPIEQMQVGEIEYIYAYKPIQYNNVHAITGDTDSKTSSVCQQCANGSDILKEFRGVLRSTHTYVCCIQRQHISQK